MATAIASSSPPPRVRNSPYPGARVFLECPPLTPSSSTTMAPWTGPLGPLHCLVGLDHGELFEHDADDVLDPEDVAQLGLCRHHHGGRAVPSGEPRPLGEVGVCRLVVDDVLTEVPDRPVVCLGVPIQRHLGDLAVEVGDVLRRAPPAPRFRTSRPRRSRRGSCSRIGRAARRRVRPGQRIQRCSTGKQRVVDRRRVGERRPLEVDAFAGRGAALAVERPALGHRPFVRGVGASGNRCAAALLVGRRAGTLRSRRRSRCLRLTRMNAPRPMARKCAVPAGETAGHDVPPGWGVFGLRRTLGTPSERTMSEQSGARIRRQPDAHRGWRTHLDGRGPAVRVGDGMHDGQADSGSGATVAWLRSGQPLEGVRSVRRRRSRRLRRGPRSSPRHRPALPSA